MATATRIYTVSDGMTQRLVRASHPSHALTHVARGAFTVKVASQDDLVHAFERGTKVESLDVP